MAKKGKYRRYEVVDYRGLKDLHVLNEYGTLKKKGDRYILIITQENLTRAHEDERLQGRNGTEWHFWNDHGPILHQF